MSSETTAGDAAGYVIVRTFTATDDAGSSSRLRRPSLWGHHRSEFTFVCRLHRECSDEMPMDDATRRTTAEGQSVSAKPPLAMLPQLRDRSHVHRHRRRWKQLFGYADHHGAGHHRSEFTFVPADYTVECSTRCRWSATASDNCRRSQSRCPAKPLRAMLRQLRDRSHVHRHRRR